MDANVWVAAFEPADPFHAQSEAFLRTANSRRLTLNSPAFMIVEAGCALARRTNNPAAGAAVRDRLKQHPALTLHALDDRLLHTALELGALHLLRGADSLYAATAKLVEGPLVSWDQELVQRAGAVTPTAWLTANA